MKYKYLAILLFILVACKTQKQQFNKTSCEIKNKTEIDTVALCEIEFKQYLKDSLSYLRKSKRKNSITVLKVTSHFIKDLKVKFKPCLMEKTLLEITNLLGTTRLELDNKRLIYICVKEELDISKGMPLVFNFNKKDKVKSISFKGRFFSEDDYVNEKDKFLCEEKFKQYLKDSLSYIKSTEKGSISVLIKRNDSLIIKLESEFRSCIIGRTPLEITELLGRNVVFNNEIVYFCLENKGDMKNAMLLIFKIGKDKKIESISYKSRSKVGSDFINYDIDDEKQNDD